MLRLGAGLAIFVALGTVVGWKSIAYTIREADAYLIMLSLLIGLGARVAHAVQMSIIMSAAGTPVGFVRIMMANSLAAFYGLVVPGEIAAGYAKWAYLASHTGKRSIVLNAMIYNRMIMLMPWFLTGLLALSIRNPWGSMFVFYFGLTMVSILVIASTLVYSKRYGLILDRYILAFSKAVLLRPIHTRVKYLLTSLAPFREFSPMFHLLLFLISSVIMCISLTAQLTMAAAAEIEIHWLDYTWISAAIRFLSQLPLTFQGIGVNDAAYVVMLGQYGVESANALAFRILNLSHAVVFALVGGCFQVYLLISRDKSSRRNTNSKF